MNRSSTTVRAGLGLSLCLIGVAVADRPPVEILPADVVPLPAQEAQSLGDIVADPHAFHRRAITVRGVLDDIVHGGGWLYCIDQVHRLFVRIPDGVMPVENWTEVTISGVVEVSAGQAVIVAPQILSRAHRH